MNQRNKLLESDSPRTLGYSKGVYQTLWFGYRAFRGRLSLYILLGFLGRLLLLGNANIIGYWVDSFCQNRNQVSCKAVPSFFANFDHHSYIVLLAWLTGVGFILTWVFRVGFSAVSAHAVSLIYDETTLRSSRFPMKFYDLNPTGRIITRFSSDYGNVFRLFGGPLAEFLSILFDLICMIALVGIASPLFLPIVFGIGGLNYVIYRLNRDSLRKIRREYSASRSPSVAHFAETVQGATTIRTFNKEETFTSRFNFLDQYFLGKKKLTVKKVLTYSFQMNFLTALLLLLTGILSFYLNSIGLVSVGAIGVAFGFIALSGNTIQMFFEWMGQFEEAMIGVERLDQYLRSPMEIGSQLPSEAKFATQHWTASPKQEQENSSRLENFPLAVKVEFKDVWLNYMPDLPPVLKGVSFSIGPGEKWGIVGRTGSGKSSLIQALFHFYPMSSGKILIGDESPKLAHNQPGIDLELFRKQIAFIAQDPVLFRGPLRKNLDLEDRFSSEKLINALERVGLDQWANADGLEFEIEERGRNLSLGEKQLLCLARCLLSNCPLIIMDEATSSVDPKSEEIMIRATEDLFEGKTQIIIAHRLATLEKCDQILWLQNGEVEMIGPPNEVLPIFRKSNLGLSLKASVVKPKDGQ